MNKIYMPQPMIAPVKNNVNKSGNSTISKANNTSFAEVLQSQITKNEVKFSAHAQKRLSERNIELDSLEMAKLESAFDKAQSKGAKESLVIIESRAYVISVPNKVVITAVDEKSLKDNVFTNIDSAIIM
ncbi:MAG: TIGR02530 family flagellar biosynthesis protein [Bacillota bacterium]|nr:TIGR02530 family flagellar biosynthesis protein [Bacillota bacterium]